MFPSPGLTMVLLILFCSLFSSPSNALVTVADDSLQELLGNDRVLFDHTVKKYKLFGNKVNAENITLAWMTEIDHQVWCENTDEQAMDAIMEKYSETIIMFDEHLDFQCNGQHGFSFSNYDYLPFWCKIKPVAFLRTNVYLFPGLFSNENDGNEFRDYEEFQDECNFVTAQFQVEGGLKLREHFFAVEASNAEVQNDLQIQVNIETQDSYSLQVFSSTLCILLARVLVPALSFTTAAFALTYLYKRIRGNLYTRMQVMILSINASSCIILTIVEALGSRYLADNMSNGVVLYFFTALWPTSVATDYLMAIEYQFVRQRLEMGKPKYVKTLYAVAILLFCVDVALSVAIVFTRSSTYTLMRLLSSSLCVSLQVLVVLILLYQTRKMVILIREKRKLLLEHEQSEKTRFIAKCNDILERNIRFWVRLSASCATLTVFLYVLAAMQYNERGPWTWALFWGTLNICKLGNLFSQIKVCAPPPSFEKYRKSVVIPSGTVN